MVARKKPNFRGLVRHLSTEVFGFGIRVLEDQKRVRSQDTRFPVLIVSQLCIWGLILYLLKNKIF